MKGKGFTFGTRPGPNKRKPSLDAAGLGGGGMCPKGSRPAEHVPWKEGSEKKKGGEGKEHNNAALQVLDNLKNTLQLPSLVALARILVSGKRLLSSEKKERRGRITALSDGKLDKKLSLRLGLKTDGILQASLSEEGLRE